MSEVTRYRAPALIDGQNVMKSAEGFSVVSAAHYDAAQSELAALREELAKANADKEAYRLNAIARRDDLDTRTADLLECGTRRKLAEQRLADAERRNAELVELLEKVTPHLRDLASIRDERGQSACAGELHELADVCAALTKPEEAKS